MSMDLELKKRVTTGVLGGAGLLLLLLLGGRIGVALIGAIISVGMLYEFLNFSLRLSDKTEKVWLLLAVCWLVHLVSFWVPGVLGALWIGCVLFLAGYFLLTAERHKDCTSEAASSIPEGGHPGLYFQFQELLLALFGLSYLGFLMLFWTDLYHPTQGPRWIFLFLFIVWAGDTGAYFAGRKFGKTKLYPLISPKKTREGLLGGIAASMVVTFLYKVLGGLSGLSWAGVVVIPLLIGVVAPLGDLIESFMKRAYGKKDSGALLPGHGGLLDRFDSVVFSVPVMVACMKLFN